jgi:hypothetical protein
MSITQKPTLNNPLTAAHRCCICNRPLPTGLGRAIPGIGVVGPDCRSKFASLERYLESVGLPKILEGTQQINPSADVGTLNRIQNALFKLRRSGLEVTLTPGPEGSWLIQIVGMDRKGRDAFKASFRRDSWEQWAEQVKLRDLERQEAADWEASRSTYAN